MNHKIPLSTGVDIVEVRRVDQAVARWGLRFLERVFTPREQAQCAGRCQSLAARFAAKEAAAKALGTGIGVVSWREVEILADRRGKPHLHLHGNASRLATRQGLQQWAVSLSHSREYAIATVVASTASGP